MPKSTHKGRIVENFDMFDFELASEDMAAICCTGWNKSGQ